MSAPAAPERANSYVVDQASDLYSTPVRVVVESTVGCDRGKPNMAIEVLDNGGMTNRLAVNWAQRGGIHKPAVMKKSAAYAVNRHGVRLDDMTDRNPDNSEVTADDQKIAAYRCDVYISR